MKVALGLACWLAALSVMGQEINLLTSQQQRPRRVETAPDGVPTERQDQPPRQTAEEIDDGDTVRVETQLISVPVGVMDKSGRPIAKLKAEDFKLYEDNRQQQITNFATTDVPFEVALMLDTSGSTRSEVALIRRAALAFLDTLRPGDRVSILAFNTPGEGDDSLATVEIKARLTEDREVLRRAIEELGSSNGTPFYDALLSAADQVFKEPPTKERAGRRALVALTDGVDSSSNSDYARARAALAEKGLACYFIQIDTEEFVEDRLLRDCESDGVLHLSRTQLERYRRIFLPQSDASDYTNFCELGLFQRMRISRQLYNLARREMNELAQSSGGMVALAKDLRDARRAFAEVAASIGTQFSLGYYPANKARDGKYRKIRVEARSSDGPLTVRAREGYVAPKS
ncbi:MAG: VWA domain-containing protein [Pyrinomonadaceae bacterium]